MTTKIEIKTVASRKDLRRFVNFHYDLYKDCPYDAPNLFADDMRTLSRRHNAAFDFCDAELFLALKEGRIVGRVAAIINRRANERWGKKAVRFGWLDFVDDRSVSAALFRAVEDYGRRHGMNEMTGPLGFTDLDPEGMLTWGFDQLGTMATIYNYEYYPAHVEAYGGFEVDTKYVEYKMYVPTTVPEKYTRIAEMITKRYNLHIRKLTRRDVKRDGYGRKIFELINETYRDLYGFVALTDKQIDQYVNMYFPFADLNLITLVEDWNADRKLVGVGITMPSLTHALRRCRRGRLLPFGWWHLLRAIKQHRTPIVDLHLLGVLPEYRPKGANALLFADLIPRYQAYGFEWGESQIELEDNNGVQSQWDALQPEMHKRRKCYSKKL